MLDFLVKMTKFKNRWQNVKLTAVSFYPGDYLNILTVGQTTNGELSFTRTLSVSSGLKYTIAAGDLQIRLPLLVVTSVQFLYLCIKGHHNVEITLIKLIFFFLNV